MLKKQPCTEMDFQSPHCLDCIWSPLACWQSLRSGASSCPVLPPLPPPGPRSLPKCTRSGGPAPPPATSPGALPSLSPREGAPSWGRGLCHVHRVVRSWQSHLTSYSGFHFQRRKSWSQTNKFFKPPGIQIKQGLPGTAGA